jgi:hypothetical protein
VFLDLPDFYAARSELSGQGVVLTLVEPTERFMAVDVDILSEGECLQLSKTCAAAGGAGDISDVMEMLDAHPCFLPHEKVSALQWASFFYSEAHYKHWSAQEV